MSNPALSRPASLARNFTSSVAGNVIYAACQWGTVMALAKLGSPEVVGQFALALALTAPVLVFSQLNLRAVQATDTGGEYVFADYLALRLCTTTLAVALLGAAILAMGYRGTVVAVILLVAAAKAIDSVTDVFLGEWQRAERLDAVSAVYAMNGTTTLAGLLFAWATTGSLVVAALAYAGGSALALGFAFSIHPRIAGARVPRPSAPVVRLWKLTRLALPLGPVMFLVTLNGTIPRYFVSMDLGNRDLGIFAALSYLVVAGTTLVGAMGQSLSPRLARRYSSGDIAGFRKLLGSFLLGTTCLGVCGVLIGALAGRPILTLIYSAEYGAAAPTLVAVLVAGALGYIASVMGYALTAARQFVLQIPLMAASVTATAVAALLLVPKYGISGAAWASAFGATVQILGSIQILRARSRGAQPSPLAAAGPELTCEIAQVAGSAAVLSPQLNSLHGDR